MALLNWTAEAFGTNITAADEEHKVIFDMVNTLNDTVGSGDRAAIGKQLDGLIAYVAGHFKTEEDLFDAHGYPGTEAHKKLHAELVNTCLDVQKKFHAGELDITGDTCVFVKDWLYSHIPNHDKHYGPYLNEKGVG
ncbi:bacteriohemerythrin [Methylomagnum ishizawai]|uniref:bacteriohemerythrin n=1 Tax=Methylomagnum ishizawai TaxID=1760988 RepID=UPI001C331E28|nr:bacteriohemerythrin [Methylomagnum ishizawai]BBL73582.1 bacteriohemerythrin [Methylomagnum ishizawai]